jgi:hypothetical protein
MMIPELKRVQKENRPTVSTGGKQRNLGRNYRVAAHGRFTAADAGLVFVFPGVAFGSLRVGAPWRGTFIRKGCHGYAAARI